MSFLPPFLSLALGAAVLLLPIQPASAQSGPPPAADKAAPKPGEQAAPKKVDEYEEAAKTISGPAGNAECVKLGRTVVNNLWRDDLDTAFRHLDLYDRFGCPGGHVQMAFRCLVRQGDLDPKANEKLAARVHACWMNPAIAPSAAAAAATPSPGTTAQ